MKKKMIFIIIILIIVLVFIGINIKNAFCYGNQEIEITTNNRYYVGSNIDGIIRVKDSKTSDPIENRVKIVLCDSNNKKVKGTETIIQTVKNNGNFSIQLPKNLDKGKYTLSVNCKSKKGTDKVKKDILIDDNYKENINITLDKGIYKPKDTINYRILLTEKQNDTPLKKDINVSIYDGNDNRVYLEKLSSSNFGISSGKFTLGDEVNSGTYKIKVETLTQEITKSFTVNPYITPMFSTDITTEKENYLINEIIKITVNSKYFFGEPVKNAVVKLKINDKEEQGITNEQGIFEYQYLSKNKETLNISAEVTDESNYLVEASKKIYIAEDKFEIEVLPEYKNITRNISNDIYFITKNAEGIGKKTYITVNFDEKISRQIITDDEGIGVLNLSKEDIDSFKNSVINTKIVAKDMEGNEINKQIKLTIETNQGVLIKTDKVKYNEEDDIEITLNSNKNILDTNIAICKNDKMLKLISTSDDRINVNLEDTYGLIDIYALNNKTAYINKNDITNKKTIFIKPSKKLDIELKTDKEEYMPKDELNMSFSLKDENGSIQDAALLISGLDEAVLKVENNDLSIDNIKLALEDIKFSNELDAATIYLNIVENKSESALMSLLLRQENNYTNINTLKLDTTAEKENAIILSVMGGIILIILVIIYLMIKFKVVREIILNIIAVFTTYMITLGISQYVLYIFDWTGEYFIIPYIIIPLVSTLILYPTLIYKIRNRIARNILSYFIVFLAFGLSFEMIENFGGVIKWIIIAIEIILFPALAIVSYVLKRKKTKEKIMEKIFKIAIEMIKSIIISAVFILTALESSFIATAVFIILNLIYELKFVKRKDEKEIIIPKILTAIGIAIISIVIFGIISLGLIIIKYNDNKYARSSILDYYPDIYQRRDGANSVIDSVDGIAPQTSTNTSKSKDSPSSLFRSNNLNESDEKNKEEDSNANQSIESKNEKVEKEEENVRSLFLESLCFIPELIAKDGKAETNITLSDNITTWKMQIVGNTENGNIGYTSKNILVKKDFFADFSLPTNTIVGDEIKIPVTVYNYTNNAILVTLDIEQKDWFECKNYDSNITLDTNSSKLVYIPISILKAGNNSFKVKATYNGIEDIVQKTMDTKNKGIEVQKLVSSGSTNEKIKQDIIYDVKAVENTKSLKIKLYPSVMSQVVEGLENIFRMPTGCFEQTSSSLYPDIMVLKYMQETGTINHELKDKALKYISSGYQRLLTFEVQGEKGGYSLYGKSPANPSLTAYGLMELVDLSKVYNVDENVINNMKEYLYKKQKSNGSFDLANGYSSIIQKTDELSSNAYIIWALSEADKDNKNLEKSIKYLKDNLDKINDPYTASLAANTFANVGDKNNSKILIDRVLSKITVEDNITYLKSNVIDCYGSYGRIQNIQTTALTSIALSKININAKTNRNFIDYIIKSKDSYGTWGNTQATVLALRALVEYKEKSDLSNTTIKVKINDDEKEIKIGENVLDVYELKYDNLGVENHLELDIGKGSVYYEIIENYYQESNEYKENSKNNFEIVSNMPNNCKINEKVEHSILIKNTSENFIKNGMIEITIPQGFAVNEESLSKLVSNKKIEKYEYNYSKIYLYIKDFENNNSKDVNITYRALYPGKITGGTIRVYDYYNSDVETIKEPYEIQITE